MKRVLILLAAFLVVGRHPAIAFGVGSGVSNHWSRRYRERRSRVGDVECGRESHPNLYRICVPWVSAGGRHHRRIALSEEH